MASSQCGAGLGFGKGKDGADSLLYGGMRFGLVYLLGFKQRVGKMWFKLTIFIPCLLVSYCTFAGDEWTKFLDSGCVINKSITQETGSVGPVRIVDAVPTINGKNSLGRRECPEQLGAGSKVGLMQGNGLGTSIGSKRTNDRTNDSEDTGNRLWRHVLGGVIGLLIGVPLSLAIVKWLMRRDGL